MKADCTYFSNTACEYYPCHRLAEQNCLFCYCPLYTLECGGNFSMIGDIKDCSACTLVHDDNGYAYVQKKLRKKET
jgi:Zn-finger protein